MLHGKALKKQDGKGVGIRCKAELRMRRIQHQLWCMISRRVCASRFPNDMQVVGIDQPDGLVLLLSLLGYEQVVHAEVAIDQSIPVQTLHKDGSLLPCTQSAPRSAGGIPAAVVFRRSLQFLPAKGAAHPFGLSQRICRDLLLLIKCFPEGDHLFQQLHHIAHMVCESCLRQRDSQSLRDRQQPESAVPLVSHFDLLCICLRLPVHQLQLQCNVRLSCPHHPALTAAAQLLRDPMLPRIGINVYSLIHLLCSPTVCTTVVSR